MISCSSSERIAAEPTDVPLDVGFELELEAAVELAVELAVVLTLGLELELELELEPPELPHAETTKLIRTAARSDSPRCKRITTSSLTVT
ncbi:MAG TPA: hypothetical protein VMD48_10425 [Solirubrobacteraceae bacterium]|nr:hypothetical protein [Solirubrobacteraceae bacterium]